MGPSIANGLRAHPASAAEGVAGIEVEVERLAGDALALTYRLHGDISALRLPEPREPSRANRLWERTCFEAFVRLQGDEAYFEFNFSPSGEWAAYRLSGYRSGMSEAEIEPPAIETRSEADLFELRATIRLMGGGRLGLSAIVEDEAGRKSWWALAHPPGEPDFHHPACFAFDLPPADEP